MPLGMVTTRSTEQAQTKAMEFSYTNTATVIPKQWPRLFSTVDFDPKRSIATIMPVAPLGLHRSRTEGGAFVSDAPQELIPQTFTFSTMGLQSYVTEEAQMEDPIGFMGMIPEFLANSERYTQDATIWNTINFAASPSVPGSDGQPLASSVHPLGPYWTSTGITSLTAMTFSNYLGSAPLTPESFRQAEILLETLLDDRANPDRRTAKFLLVGPQMVKTAQEVMGAKLAPYTNQNQPNTANDQAEIMAVRYITSPTAWALVAAPGNWRKNADCNMLVVGFKWQSRVHAWYDNPTGNYAIRSSFRYTFGFAGWRGFVYSSGS